MIIDVIAKGGLPVQSVGNAPYGLPVTQGIQGLAFPVTIVTDGWGLPVLNIGPPPPDPDPTPEPPNTPASFFRGRYFGESYFGGGFY